MVMKTVSEKNDVNNNYEGDPELNMSSFRQTTANSTIEERKFPDAFYCASTKELLKDPVVASDGKSYERSVITNTEDYQEDKLYLNRALKEVIDEVVELSGDSIQSKMLRYRRFFQESMQGILDKTPIPSEHIYPLPDAYHCPITFGLIHVPVIDPEGNTFEKVAIDAWITQNHSSPITRTPQSIHDLYPNHAISSLLEYEKNRDDEFMHPSIRKFKEEEPPQAPIPIEVPSDRPQVQVLSPTRNLFPRTPEQLYAEREHRSWRSKLRAWKITMVILLIPTYYYGQHNSGIFLFIVIFAAITLPIFQCYHKITFRKRHQNSESLPNQTQTRVIRLTRQRN